MYESLTAGTDEVLKDVKTERLRQTRKHGSQVHLPDGTGPELSLLASLQAEAAADLSLLDNAEAAEVAKRYCRQASENEGGDRSIGFSHILAEEFLEAMAEDDPDLLYAELVQVAAVAVQWCEKLNSMEKRRRRR